MNSSTNIKNRNDATTRFWIRSKTLDLAYARSKRISSDNGARFRETSDSNITNSSNDSSESALGPLNSWDGKSDHKANNRPWAWTFVHLLSATLDGGMVMSVQDETSVYNGKTIEVGHDLLHTTVKGGSILKNRYSKYFSKRGEESSRSSSGSDSPGGRRKTELPSKMSNIHMANPSDDGSLGATKILETTPMPPHDLQSLPQLHEPTVVHSLQRRYEKDIIYTSTGNQILVTLNPFKAIGAKLPYDENSGGLNKEFDLYGDEMLESYAKLGEWELKFGSVEVNAATTTSDAVSRGASETQPLPPHVFRISDTAFRNMMKCIHSNDAERPNPDQSILVSGESGAGKTVTTKHVLRYLASLSQWRGKLNSEDGRASLRNIAKTTNRRQSRRQLARRPSVVRGTGLFPVSGSLLPQTFCYKRKSLEPKASISSTGSSSHGSISSSSRASWTVGSLIEVQILEANPILEAFGNARTVRNDNSSRFGKFIELQFKSTGSLIGASIETYLLEKVRLVHTQEWERNYHIFYEIMEGASEEELKQYLLDGYRKEDFKMMSMSGVMDRRDGVVDQEEFDILIESMALLQFEPSHIKSIMKITAACMHALNLTFLAPSADESDLDDSNPHLLPFLTLLGLERNTLRDTLCSYEISIGQKDKQRRNQTKGNAEKGLEALIKAIYNALFNYLVDHINTRMSCKPSIASSKAASIGILDIFGFEAFQKNSLEQLCINFCNETLQQQFNQVMFKSQKEEYDREGIDSSFIKFPDNKDAIDLIEKIILATLNEVSFAPSPNDDKFASSLYVKMEQNANHRFKVSPLQKGNKQFLINHSAGPVEYNTETFVQKNKDEIPRGTTALLESSSDSFLNKLSFFLSDQGSTESGGSGSSSSSIGARVKRNTVAKHFTAQLKHLHSKISCTTQYFVRCIKPNQELSPDCFCHDVVLDQLQCLGVLEAVRVSRMGFPKSYSHGQFVQQYFSLADKKLRDMAGDESKDICKIIVDASMSQLTDFLSKGDEKGFQIGMTKIFLRERNANGIEWLRNKKHGEAAVRIQRAARLKIARNERTRRRKEMSAVKIQCHMRRFIAVREMLVLVEKNRVAKMSVKEAEGERRKEEAAEEATIKKMQEEEALSTQENPQEKETVAIVSKNQDEEADSAEGKREEREKKIQSQVTAFLSVSDMLVQKYSATVIQKYYRGIAQRIRYQSLLEKKRDKERQVEVLYLNKAASNVSQITTDSESDVMDVSAHDDFEPSIESRARSYWVGDVSYGSKSKHTSKADSLSLSSKKSSATRNDRVPPKGIPRLKNWKVTNDKSITGCIYGSQSFKDGEPVTTSQIRYSNKKGGEVCKGVVVETVSGSKYYLD